MSKSQTSGGTEKFEKKLRRKEGHAQSVPLFIRTTVRRYFFGGTGAGDIPGLGVAGAVFGVAEGEPFGPAGVGENAGDGAVDGDVAGLGLAAGLFGTLFPLPLQAEPIAAAIESVAVNRILVFIVFS